MPFTSEISTSSNPLVTLERAVLFVGHQFSQKISFFSELEIENAKVEGGVSNNAEISMEQAFLKFNLNAHQYLIAGLFTPRIGIFNENHLPVNFNGVERPIVETLIIPATWRELGIAFYGNSEKIPLELQFCADERTGWCQHFEHGTGIRDGRAEGNLASANNIAITAALQYFWKNFKFQVSAYSGGTVTLSTKGADSLGLNGGAFGTPIYLGEADVQYEYNACSAKALGVYISYPDAGKMNTVYGNNTSTGMYGAYAGNRLQLAVQKIHTGQALSVLSRFEALNMNSSIAANGRRYLRRNRKTNPPDCMGFGYLPAAQCSDQGGLYGSCIPARRIRNSS